MPIGEKRVAELEARLLEMAAAYPVTPSVTLPGAVPALMYGARARSQYAGLLHTIEGPSEPTVAVALRPLIEATIRLKWYSLNPDPHRALLAGMSADAELTLYREIRHYLRPNLDAQAEEASYRADVEGAAAAAAFIGRNYGGRAGPSLARMVDEIAELNPGHETAIRQAYVLGFRAMSRWVHTEASSFDGTMELVSPTVTRFLGDRVNLGIPGLRRLGGSMMAYSIETVSLFTMDAPAVTEARAIRDEMVDADAYRASLG